LNDQFILDSLVKNLFSFSKQNILNDSFLIEVYLMKSKILLISFHYQIQIEYINDSFSLNFSTPQDELNPKWNQSLSKILNETKSIPVLIHFINKNLLNV
jgi:hypothetical protein